MKQTGLVNSLPTELHVKENLNIVTLDVHVNALPTELWSKPKFLHLGQYSTK